MTKVTPELFSALADKAKLEQSFIEDTYKEIFDRLTNDGHNPDNIEDAALYELTTALKSHVRSPAIEFEGIILGFTQPFDWRTGPKSKQQRFLKNLMAEADSTVPLPYMINQLIEKGYAIEGSTPEQIIWRDTEAKFKSGNDNPNFGKPWLPAEQTAIMNIFGIIAPSAPIGGKELPPKGFNITASDDEWFSARPGINNLVLNKDIRSFIPMKTKFNYDAEKSDEFHFAVNPSRVTEFNYLDTTINILALCKTAIPDQVSTVSTLHEHFNKFGSDQFVVFEGGVQNMVTKPSPIGIRKLYVDDPYASPLDMFNDDGVAPDTLVEIPKHLKLDFARGTRAIFVGLTKQKEVNQFNQETQKWEPVMEGGRVKMELYVEAAGIYPIPEYTVKLQKAQDIPEDNEAWS